MNKLLTIVFLAVCSSILWQTETSALTLSTLGASNFGRHASTTAAPASSVPPAVSAAASDRSNVAATVAVAAAANSAAKLPDRAQEAADAAAAAAAAIPSPKTMAEYTKAAKAIGDIISATRTVAAANPTDALNVVKVAAEKAALADGHPPAATVVWKAVAAATTAGATPASVATAAINEGTSQPPSEFITSVLVIAAKAAAIPGTTSAAVVAAIADTAAKGAVLDKDLFKNRCEAGGLFPSNCRAFISYSSGSNSGLNFLNNVNYTSTGSSSKIKVNPLTWNIKVGRNDYDYIPLIIYSNAQTGENSVKLLRSNLLDNEGGLVNAKLEYDLFPYNWVINNEELNASLNHAGPKVPAYGFYMESFGGGKYIQASGIDVNGASSGASNFGQIQAGLGFDAILPVLDHSNTSLQGSVALRALYIGNYISTSSLETVFKAKDLPRFFGYGQIILDLFIANQVSVSLSFSGLDTAKAYGSIGTFSISLFR